MVILMAIEQWRPYLHNEEFIIRTDQRSLVHLDDQYLSTPWQQKAFTKLLGLRYKICYRPGPTNSAADALSRRTPDASITAISVCKSAWLDDIVASYETNPQVQNIIRDLDRRPDPKKRFAMRDGLLYFRDRIWLGGSPSLQQRMLCAFHDSTMGGHSGVPVTYRRLHHLFAWPKMKEHIK